MNEVWKDVVNYEGLYEVSNLGRVRSLQMWNGHCYKKREKPHILLQTFTTTGYKKITLSKNKHHKHLKVHRLVAQAFISNDENKPNINHLDFNPINNNANNLEWCSQTENIWYSSKHHKLGKIKDWQTKANIINDYKDGILTNEIAKKYGVSKTMIYNLLEKNGIKRVYIGKYKIDKNKLKELLKTNMGNKEIAKILNCTSGLVATRRNQTKMGVF